MMRENRIILMSLVLIIVIGAAIYSNSYHVAFQFDDMSVIVKNPFIKQWYKPLQLFQYDPTRFLTHLSFGLNLHFNGLDVSGFHLVNLIIHILCAILVFFLVKLTLNLPGLISLSDSKRIDLVALFSALIFLSHPLQTESVTYIVQRSTELAAFFYFLALILYIKLREKFRWFCYLGLWLSVALGSIAKPIFVTLPIMILLYELSSFPASWIARKKYGWLFLPFGVTLLVVPFFLMLFSMNYYNESFDFSKLMYATRATSEISRWDYLLTQFRVILTYIRLLFVPINQNLDYDYPLAHNIFEPRIFLSLCVILAILGLSVFLWKRKRILSFSILWFFVALSVESTIFPLTDVIFEHRLYIAAVGYAIFLSISLAYLIKDQRRYIFALSFIILSYSLLTYARNIVWQDRICFVKDILRKSPNKARQHNNLGNLYQEAGWIDLAKEEYQKTLMLDAKFVPAYNNLGRIYAEERKSKEAFIQYQKALEIEPNYYEANLNLGNLYYNYGRWVLAVAQFKKLIEIRPNAEIPYLNLGNVYSQMKNFGDAESYYRQAIAQNSRFAPAYYGLGNLYLGQQMYPKAAEFYKQATAFNPGYVDAYNSLGIAYAESGNLHEAEICFKKVIELKPDYALAYLNLGNFYKKTGRTDEAEKYNQMAWEIEKRQNNKNR